MARATSIHHGSLQCPVMARYPPTGAIDKPTPSTRCDQRVNRFVYLENRTPPSASGARIKQRMLSCHAATKNTSDAIVTATLASRTLIDPEGISLDRVRGLRASISRSTIRLNPIAANRADVKATITQTTSL